MWRIRKTIYSYLSTFIHHFSYSSFVFLHTSSYTIKQVNWKINQFTDHSTITTNYQQHREIGLYLIGEGVMAPYGTLWLVGCPVLGSIQMTPWWHCSILRKEGSLISPGKGLARRQSPSGRLSGLVHGRLKDGCPGRYHRHLYLCP